MTTECTPIEMEFQGVGRRKVEASFDGGYLSSDGGALLLVVILRRSNIDACDGTVPVLERLVQAIRKKFPDTRIILRGDSGFCRDYIMAWCEMNDAYYVLGLAKNCRLIKMLDYPMFKAAIRHSLTGVACREFLSFEYQTRDSWSRPRRVIGKAEVLTHGTNPRFIVTNLPEDYATPADLYEKVYCARGEMENRIKEQQLGARPERSQHRISGRVQCQNIGRSRLLGQYWEPIFWVVS